MASGAGEGAFTVGVDVSSLAGGRTGIARYTYELIGGLGSVLPQERVIAVGHRPGVRLPSGPAGRPAEVRGPTFPSRSAWTFGLLPFWLSRARIDVYHATSYYAPVGTRVPTVVTIHDLGTFAYPALHPRSRVLRARAILPVVARSADAIIVPSKSVEAEAIGRLGARPDRIHVVPEAPAEPFTRPVGRAEVEAALARYRLEPGFFLALGALEPRKNLARVFEALERLPHSTAKGGPRLAVAGPAGWKPGAMEKALGRPGMADRVRLLGFVPDADLCALMVAARALVYPSLYEGFGLPVVEAMAAGLPVITSNRGALAELAEGAALLVEPLDAGSIAEAMRRLMEDEGLRLRLAARGRVRAGLYSWSRTARETVEVYRAAIERAGDGR